MRHILVILAALALSAGAATAQSTPACITPAPKEVTLQDGVLAWPFRILVNLGDRDFRRRVYHLPEFAHKEAYEIIVGPDVVTVNAVTDKAYFYARLSIAQMVATCDTLRCCHIIDYPDEEVRGTELRFGPGEKSAGRVLSFLERTRFEKGNLLTVYADEEDFTAEERREIADTALKYYITLRYAGK